MFSSVGLKMDQDQVKRCTFELKEKKRLKKY